MTTLGLLLSDPVSLLEFSAAVTTLLYIITGLRLRLSQQGVVAVVTQSRPSESLSSRPVGSQVTSLGLEAEGALARVSQVVKAVRKSAFPIYPYVGQSMRLGSKRSLSRQFS